MGVEPFGGIIVLMEEKRPERTLCITRGHSEKMEEPVSQEECPHWELNQHMHTRSLNLDFAACRTMRNKCLLFKPLSLWYFVWRPGLTNTYSESLEQCLAHSKTSSKY